MSGKKDKTVVEEPVQETAREILYVWNDLPINGYGTHMVLMVKATDPTKAFEIAKAALEAEIRKDNYELPAGFANIETMLMMADPPTGQYVDYFSAISIYICD